MDWSSMSSGGLEMVDQWGYFHTVDPWAYDSQVDFNGNVVSSYDYGMDPMIGYSDLTPAWQDNGYSGYDTERAYSWSEYDSTAYTMKESDNWAPGGPYDTSWVFE